MSSLGIDQMLERFEKEATDWLDKVKTKFDSNNLQFDENFRQMFIQTSTDRLNATYSKFILNSQLNATSHGTSNTPRIRNVPLVTTTTVSRNVRAQGSPVKREAARGRQLIIEDDDDVEADPNAGVEVNIYDPFDNDDDNNGNDNDPSVDGGDGAGITMDDDHEPDDHEVDGNVSVTVTQQTIEVKPNLAYGFRDRNSPIFSRRRRAINALLEYSQLGKRTNPPKKNPTKKNPPKKNPPRKRKPAEKKYKCDQCNYSTAFNSRLKEHGQVHSQTKPFECEICKERLGYRHSLKKHTLRRHGVILLN